MSSRAVVSLILATSVLGGCATEDDGDSGGAGGKADGDAPVIEFADDWSETVHGQLLAGSPVRIAYDLDRLQDCRGSTNGSEVWGVSGFASFDSGAPVTFGVSRLDGGVVRPVTAELEIPAGADSVQLWFSISNRWGCVAYDSNDNTNYAFDVTRGEVGPVLAFHADWSETQTGVLRAGDEVTIHYDPSRLSRCATSRNGTAAWSVTMYYKVDGGAVKTMIVTRPDGADLVAADPRLTVPRGSALELWFSASSGHGCNAYDSNLGGNYRYTIQ
jgi:uncharacterized protein YraI